MRMIVRHDLSRLSARLGRLAGSLEEPLRAIGGIVESSTPRRTSIATVPGPCRGSGHPAGHRSPKHP